MTKKVLEIGDKKLTIKDLYLAANSDCKNIQIVVSKKSIKRMNDSRAFVLKIIKNGQPVYGINTGFGALANQHIKNEDLAQLQVNLIRSHCTGVGPLFEKNIVKAIMIIRAHCLAIGKSGLNPEIVKLLVDFINNDIIPVVPSKGSVGASGDLAPLSHIAYALIGEGEVFFKNKKIPAKKAIQAIRKKPIILGPKDGLALINGTAVMTALAALATYDAHKIMKLADIAAVMTLDGVRGTSAAYHPLISSLKPHQGQKDCVVNLNKLLKNSQINSSHKNCAKVQDPYSLRCVPQVHGACRQTLLHAFEVITTELNSVTDNPLVFTKENLVISGGNFHGEAMALIQDYLAMGIAEICNISERRVEKMMNPTFSELPAFLTANSGLNSGLMIAHVTAAALTSENKTLAHPCSVDSIPTSTDKEDHVSMGVNSGRKLHEIIRNAKHCLAIEFLCNTQAIDFQRPLKSSPAIEAACFAIRKKVKHINEDRFFHKDMTEIYNLIEADIILKAVEEKIGELK